MLHPKLLASLIAVAALATAGVAANANGTNQGADLACGISTVTERGMLVVEGVFQSPTALSGEYRFALKSIGGGGSTNVSQGGQFSAAAGTAVSLGKVMVNADASVDVDFTVSTDGKRLDCSAPLTLRS
jgi:hypothetical protein